MLARAGRRRDAPDPNAMTKIGPNERCPCGSGKKYKKCCDGPHVVATSQPDRARALAALHTYVNVEHGDEEDKA